MIPILMLGMVISILLVGREIQERKRQLEEDEKRADDAGLSGNYHRVYDADRCRNDSKNVWKRIAEDYGITRGKTGRKREAYEEIWRTWQEMKSGIPEMECYERFARRCDLIPYMKMGAHSFTESEKGCKKEFLKCFVWRQYRHWRTERAGRDSWEKRQEPDF